jgi:large subunit ribosomal protein L6
MIEIPQGVSLRIEGQKMTAKGPQGEVHKTLSKEAFVSVKGNQVEVTSNSKALLGTTESIISSMLKGVTAHYTKNFKLIYAHFPISIEVKGSDVTIKNFLGEKMARKTVLVGVTKLVAKGQSVTISGPDKEALGQTIANLRTAMKIKDKDSRIFQDGIYEID